MKAIPTKYAGIQFRSRLEARWAAFFDLLAWPWEYEPIDLQDYVPDFILKFHRPLLVEVKPLLGQFESTDSVFAHAAIKINNSGWEGESIVVGSSIDKHGMDYYPMLGRFTREELGGEFSASHGRVNLTSCLKCKYFSMSSDEGIFKCRVHDCYDGDNYLNEPHGFARLWTTAQNIVQWRGAASHSPFGVHR